MGKKSVVVPSEQEREMRDRNLRHAFHETRKLYNLLALRASKSRIFLPRNLHRGKQRPQVNKVLPSVNYRSIESGVSWQTTRNDLRCLWCKSNFFRFANRDELLNHLVTCHGMLQYSLETSKSDDPKAHIVVNVSLLRDTQDSSLNRQEPLFRKFMFEKTLVIKRKRNRRSSGADAKNDEADTKRLRPRRSCRVTRSQQYTDADANSSSELRPHSAPPMGRCSSSAGDSLLGSQNASVSGPIGADTEKLLSRRPLRKGTTRRVISKRGRGRKRPAFKTVGEGMEKGRLFHSVVQTKLHLDRYEMQDSDEEDEVEQEWLYRLRHDEIVEYLDTIPVEKIFMNLWNQFVGMEFRIDADRRVSSACIAFAEKYHSILKRTKAEFSFLRHLSEMARIGLIDSDDVYTCVTSLRKLEQKAPDQKEPRFLYAENVMRQMDVERRKRSA